MDAIARQDAAPTFDNTVAAIERAGRILERVQIVYGSWGSSMSTPDFQAGQREMAPKLSAFYDKITQNALSQENLGTDFNTDTGQGTCTMGLHFAEVADAL